MAKFFAHWRRRASGPASTSLTRIILEVLSVVAQQVLTIQQAKARKAERSSSVSCISEFGGLWRFHAVDARRLHQTRSWLVFPSLGPSRLGAGTATAGSSRFGPKRLKFGPETTHLHREMDKSRVDGVEARNTSNAELAPGPAQVLLPRGPIFCSRMTCCPFITMNPGYAGRAGQSKENSACFPFNFST